MPLPTLKDVAKEAGVSIATVSLFLNGKPGVSKNAQENILAAIERTGYTFRRSRKKDGANLIGIIIENMAYPAFSDSLYLPLMQNFEKEARQLGFHSVMTSIDTTSPPAIPDSIANNEFVGVAALGGGELSDDFLRGISATGIPMVLIDNYLLSGEIDAILPDNELGAYFATRHLIEQGYERLAVIAGPAKYKPLTDRLQGFLRAVVESGMPPENWQIQRPLSQGMPNKGYLEMKALLSQPKPPRAVFCISDRAAFGALAALNEAGLRVPADVALVGFDDSPESIHSNPSLTTVHMPKREMGIEAARRLAQIINQSPNGDIFPVKNTLPTYLIRRTSS